MAWPRLGQVEVDAIVQLRDGPMSADLLDQVGLLIVRTRLKPSLMPPIGWCCWDGPGANPAAGALLQRLGFAPIYATLRMYRGAQPEVGLADVYGLACLGLG
jgi:hypothetical protein